MKVLWLVNIIFPYPAKKLNLSGSCFGGWLNSMHRGLVKNKDLKIGIVTSYNGNALLKYNDGKTIYYLIPEKKCHKYNEKSKEYYKQIVEEFKPDIVHVHGTEYPRGLVFSDCKFNIPIVTSIQGLVSNVSDVYYANISNLDLIKSITLKDLLSFNTIFNCKNDLQKRGKYETKLIKDSDYIIGRTGWDKSNVLAIDPNKKYFKVNESLRKSFYAEEKWSLDRIERHSIFCSQASYPIKGLHILLKSISILKEKYPDIKLYIGGQNIIDQSSLMARIKRTSYGKHIKKLIKKYNLKDNICFTGLLPEEKIVDRLLKTHVFVSSSFIENECNSLSEAKILGVPSVASYVGGVTERLTHEVDGYFYPTTEPAMLATCIDKIFSNDKKAEKFSKKAIENITDIIDETKNYNDILKVYEEIIKEGK